MYIILYIPTISIQFFIKKDLKMAELWRGLSARLWRQYPFNGNSSDFNIDVKYIGEQNLVL